MVHHDSSPALTPVGQSCGSSLSLTPVSDWCRSSTALLYCQLINLRVSWENEPHLRYIEGAWKSGIYRHHPKKGIWGIFQGLHHGQAVRKQQAGSERECGCQGLRLRWAEAKQGGSSPKAGGPSPRGTLTVQSPPYLCGSATGHGAGAPGCAGCPLWVGRAR